MSQTLLLYTTFYVHSLYTQQRRNLSLVLCSLRFGYVHVALIRPAFPLKIRNLISRTRPFVQLPFPSFPT